MNTYRLEDAEAGAVIASGVLSIDGSFETPVMLVPGRHYKLKVVMDDGEERGNEFTLPVEATITGTATLKR